ncbi:NADPH flavoprotein [Portibacter lacus]|uniref:Methionine synthase reductase n=2 Tax=Portibacter lacus TaxID=1099794 RepID=A0AA37SK48_9BACT|nr:NADPH flavoprotein [Portibacter lacus]
MEDLPLSQLIDSLKNNYEEVIDIEINKNHFVKASVFSMEDELSGEFYINPFNGDKIGDIPKKKPLFEWTTNFHRSLFLKTPGRIFIGIASFFLFLISITGTILLIKRQKGFKKLFAKIVKDDFYQYYHVIFGRLSLIPIIIISLTGVYLSLYRFELIPEKTLESRIFESTQEIDLENTKIDLFNQLTLQEISKLEFPFSSDEEDYYILDLHSKSVKVHQYSGAIIEEIEYPFSETLQKLSFNLHTGNGSILWSIILGIASLNILFFLYSGAVISFKRLRTSIKNKYSPEEASVIILIGSENGGTKRKGILLQQALLKLKKKVYLDELNNYREYRSMKSLIILTSTYGEGDPPSNADRFLELLKEINHSQHIDYSIVGFGSHAYDNFCQFAKDIDKALTKYQNYSPTLPISFIHNQDYAEFNIWATNWAKTKDLNLQLPESLGGKKEKLSPFKILEKNSVQDEYNDTFTLHVEAKFNNFQSGDLLGLQPSQDSAIRWYSIAKTAPRKILLSIKRHELGLCSNYLNDLSIGEQFEGFIKKNKDFHFPSTASEVILLSNGTGIAPFIGMLQHNTKKVKTTLFWGGRTEDSFSIYQAWVQDAMDTDKLSRFELAYSRENGELKYVQDLIKPELEYLVETLNNGGVIMICGAINMQNDVLKLIADACKNANKHNIEYYQANHQILTDCY